jgi:transcriptional regulator with XRE-family HTH domain/tetrahydromethanopterin S-methyltransferase subunit G
MLDIKEVGLKILSLRKSIGCSQEKLAELLCVTPQAISKWENGHSLPETSSLPILAQIFGCGIDDIIMSAYSTKEQIEQEKPNAFEQQAERIANVVFSKMEDKQKSKEQLGFTDEEITTAVIAKQPNIGRIVISRGKTSRTTGDICTPILVSSSVHEINLLQTIYHKQSRKENIFDSYILLNDCGVKELRNLYGIDYAKSAILAENVADKCFNMNDYNEDNADSVLIRQNYNTILRSVAGWHGTMWDNHKAFGKIGLQPHFESKENMLAWISSAMERPYKKYRKAEESGKIPKVVYENWFNNITKKELDYYEEALKFLKTEYVKLIDGRFNAGKNITVIHGDLHPGRIWMFRDSNRAALISEPEPARIGLCTEDLAMLIALHLADASLPHNVAKDFHDTVPWLDFYYKCLCKKVKGYSYKMFMNDYKISVAENLFFPIRLINNGINDFRMRDRAIRAFEVYVLK